MKRAEPWSQARAPWLRPRTSLRRRPPHGKRRSVFCHRTQRRAASHAPTAADAAPRLAPPHRTAMPHCVTSPRHLATPQLTSPRLTSPPHLTALYRHASPRLISPPDRHASPHLTSPPRLTSPHRLALRAAVGPVDARAATTACARCHRRPALRGRARFRQLTAAPLVGGGGSTLGCAGRRNPA